MKKLLVSLAAVALMALGLVGVSSSPAKADCGYQGCIHTTITVTNTPLRIERGQTPTIRFHVTAPGSVKPSGNVIVTCTSPNGKHVKSGSGPINNGRGSVTMDSPFRAKGKWLCEAKFQGDDPFRRDSVHFHIHVG